MDYKRKDEIVKKIKSEYVGYNSKMRKIIVINMSAEREGTDSEVTKRRD
jgi:hypothetical protein